MPLPWKDWIEKGKQLWKDSTKAQKILAGGILFSLIIGFVLLMIWLNQPEYGVLYSNLSPKDAASVVEALKKKNIDYKLADKGSTVLVPKEKIYDLRLEFAGKNIIQGQGVGFEIFSKTQIGETDFVQRVNYLRALQGELARTISALPNVKNARVHLVLPKKSLFLEEQTPASASILVELKEGEKLSKKEVQSIVNLVACAVEGLEKKNITLVDSNGNLLYHPEDEELFGISEAKLEYKMKLEDKLEKRIKDLLIPIIGPGKVLAKVNVDIDYSEKRVHKEVYDPDSAVVRSEQKIRETSRGTAGVEQGTPGPAYQAGTVKGTSTTQESSRTSQTINYEINKEESQIYIPQGNIKKISAAVVVDGTYKVENGKRVFIPRSQEELNKIKELVKSAIGFDATRGDFVEVTSLAFEGMPPIIKPSIWEMAFDFLQRFWKPLLNSLIILLFLLLVVRPVVLALIKPKVEEEEEKAEEIPAEEKAALEEEKEEKPMIEAPKTTLEELKEKASYIIDNYEEDAISIIKKWIREEEHAEK